MKFNIGSINIVIDISQILQGQGATIHANGEIRPGLTLDLAVSYLPVSTEPLNVTVKTYVTERGGDA